MLAGTIHDHVDLCYLVTIGHGNERDRQSVQAGGGTTNLTDEVHMVVMMMTLTA